MAMKRCAWALNLNLQWATAKQKHGNYLFQQILSARLGTWHGHEELCTGVEFEFTVGTRGVGNTYIILELCMGFEFDFAVGDREAQAGE